MLLIKNKKENLTKQTQEAKPDGKEEKPPHTKTQPPSEGVHLRSY